MRRTSRHKDTTHDLIAKWLTARGWHVYHVNTVSKFVDVIAIKESRVVFVEAKTGRNKPKPHQEALHQEIRRAGGEVAVVASEADCQAYFERPFSGWYDEKQMKKAVGM
jgi:Holliday junction resolvase